MYGKEIKSIKIILMQEKMTKKYCHNCEIELSEDVIKFERNDGIILHFCSEECKNQSIKFWRYKGLNIIEIKNQKDIKIWQDKKKEDEK